MKGIVYVLLFQTCFFPVLGQLSFSLDDDREHIARLEREVETASTDSVKAYLFLRLSSLYRLVNDTVKINYYLAKGTDLGDKYTFLKAASWFYKAQPLYAKRDVPTIEKYLLTGDSLLKPFADKEAYKIRAYIWHAYGTFQQIKGSESGAMDIFVNKALPMAQQSGDAFITGNVNKAVGIVFMNANQRQKAADYLRTATQLVASADANIATRLEALCEIHITSAENYSELDLTDSAKINLEKAWQLLHDKPSSNLNLTYFHALGAFYVKLKQYKEAVESFDKVIRLGNNIPAAQFSVNRALYTRFKALRLSNRNGEAVTTMQRLLSSPLVFATDRKLYFKELSGVYAAMGNEKEAYKYASAYITISDSLYEAKYQNDLVEFEKKYNESENKNKIAVLQAEKEKATLASSNNKLLAALLGVAGVFFLLVAAFIYFVSRNNRRLAHQRELNYQQQLNEAKQLQQLQLADALLQGEEKERKRLAGDLHDGLGGMLAGVKLNLSRLSNNQNNGAIAKDLPQVIDQLDKSVNELRRIARNMMPETLVSSGLETSLSELCESFNAANLNVNFQSFNIGNNLSKEIQVTIFRIVQELIANAVKHAYANNILVQCSQNGNAIFITVEDDGAGFDNSNRGIRNGIGLINVKNRVDYLKGKLDIESAPGEGTTINIEFNAA